jgi:hypothetical protein
MACVLLGKLDIGCSIGKDLLLLDGISLLDNFARDTDDNRAFRYFGIFPDNGTGPYHRPFPDACAIQYDRTHSYEHLIGYRTTMQDRPMTDRDIPAKGYRKTPAGMHNAVILDIGPVPDNNPVLISPHYGPEPDTDLLSYRDRAGNGCIAGHEQRLTGDLCIHTHNNIGN